MSEWQKAGKERWKEKEKGCYLSTKDLPLAPVDKLDAFNKCLKDEIVKGSQQVTTQQFVVKQPPPLEAAPSAQPTSTLITQCQRESLRAPSNIRQKFMEWCLTDVPPGKARVTPPLISQGIPKEISSFPSLDQPDLSIPLDFEAGTLRIGPLTIPLTLLKQMRRYIEQLKYKKYPARKLPNPAVEPSPSDLPSIIDGAEALELPVEQGFLLLLDSGNNLLLSEPLEGEAVFLDTYNSVQNIQNDCRILGVFHTHPHPSHSLIPGAGDYIAAKDFDSIVGYSVNLLAIGGFYGKDPIVHFLWKKAEFNWDDFLKSPVLALHDALFPDPLTLYQLQIGPSETDFLRVYDLESRIPIDLAKKIILSKYFDIVTVNLNTNRIIDSDYASAEVLTKLLQVMRLYLDRFPRDLRRKMEVTIGELYPDRPISLIVFYRNTFLHFLEKSYRMRFKPTLLGHFRRSLRFRYLRVKDIFEELKGLNEQRAALSAESESEAYDALREALSFTSPEATFTAPKHFQGAILKRERVREALKKGMATHAIAHEFSVSEMDVIKIKQKMVESGELVESGWRKLSSFPEVAEESEEIRPRVLQTTLAREDFPNVTKYVIALLESSKQQDPPYTIAEIAQLAGVTPQSVKNTLNRIRQGQYPEINIGEIKLRVEAPKAKRSEEYYTPPEGKVRGEVQVHEDPPLPNIGLPQSILDKMRQAILGAPAKSVQGIEVPLPSFTGEDYDELGKITDTFSTEKIAPSTIRALPSKWGVSDWHEITLPTEAAFLILKDAEGRFITTNIIEGEPSRVSFRDTYYVVDESTEVIGTFHTHSGEGQEILPSFIDLYEDKANNNQFIAVGAMRGGVPYVKILCMDSWRQFAGAEKRRAEAWRQFAYSGLHLLIESFRPQVKRQYLLWDGRVPPHCHIELEPSQIRDFEAGIEAIYQAYFTGIWGIDLHSGTVERLPKTDTIPPSVGQAVVGIVLHNLNLGIVDPRVAARIQRFVGPFIKPGQGAVAINKIAILEDQRSIRALFNYYRHQFIQELRGEVYGFNPAMPTPKAFAEESFSHEAEKQPRGEV